MHLILVVAILALGGVFLLVTLAIIVAKVGREATRSRRRSRRRVLEPAILAWAHGHAAAPLALLGGRVRRRDRRALESVLLDHAQRVRGIERDRLGQALDELGYVDRYLAGLRSARWWSRAQAAENLGLAHSRRAVEPLAAALHDPVYEVRLRAAKALGLLGGATAIRPLVEALSEPSRWSTIRVADVLTSMGPAVAGEIVTTFPGLARHARLAAIDVLARTRSLEAAAWLRQRLRDPDPDIRARTCHALGALGDAESGPALTAALGDLRWPVRAMAAKALGRLRHRAAVPALRDALRDHRWWVRANAAEALRVMEQEGLEALESMLDDGDDFARDQAVLMLEEAGVLDTEAAWLASPEPDRRAAARERLARVAGTGRIHLLRELAATHADPRVRGGLEDLLPPDAARPEASA